MPAPIINVGFHNFVVTNKVIAIVGSDSAPMRRLAQEYRKKGRLLDATQGRRTKSILFLEDDCVLLSAISQVTLAKRLARQDLTLDDDGAESGT